MSFKRWKLGVFSALLSAALTAGAGLANPKLTVRDLLGVFFVAAATNYANFSVRHPAAEVSFDTNQITKKDQDEKSNP